LPLSRAISGLSRIFPLNLGVVVMSTSDWVNWFV
jgi:hypothetical protein